MKPDTRYECLNKKCGTYIFGIGKYMDGLNCPRCNGPVEPKPFKPNQEVTFAVYECLCCGHKDRVTGKKEDYSEVKVCPKCNGAYVDIWKIAKYKQQDCKPSKLLTIELDSETSTPKVFYEGKEITHKIKIDFNWETKRGNSLGNMGFNIEYFETENNGFPILKGIGLNR